MILTFLSVSITFKLRDKKFQISKETKMLQKFFLIGTNESKELQNAMKVDKIIVQQCLLLL
jgi:hypothetical protein